MNLIDRVFVINYTSEESICTNQNDNSETKSLVQQNLIDEFLLTINLFVCACSMSPHWNLWPECFNFACPLESSINTWSFEQHPKPEMMHEEQVAPPPTHTYPQVASANKLVNIVGTVNTHTHKHTRVTWTEGKHKTTPCQTSFPSPDSEQPVHHPGRFPIFSTPVENRRQILCFCTK